MQLKYKRNNIFEYLEIERVKSPLYFNELKTVAKRLGKPRAGVKIVIAIPVHSTEVQLERTLNYYYAQSLNIENFDILVFLNRRGFDPSFERLKKVVKKFSKKFSNIFSFEKFFYTPVTIGYIRKFLNDVILFKYGKNPELIIVNNDADTEYLDRAYLKTILLQSQKRKEVILYGISGIPERYKKFKNYFVLNSFYWNIEDIQSEIASHLIPPRAHCYNLSYSLRTYALVGGFNPFCGIAEDLTFVFKAYQVLGNKIFIKLPVMIITSHRRFIQAYLRGRSLIDCWADFQSSTVRQIQDKFLENRLKKREKNLKSNYIIKEIQSFFSHFLINRMFINLPYNNDAQKKLDNVKIRIAKKVFKLAARRLNLVLKVKKINHSLYNVHLLSE